ncbi:MAG: hypothetical protein OXK20_00445 [Deltaproteobacteria bacterium]|nr:hypothetical protein [Deltaproteobacteria bacterium]
MKREKVTPPPLDYSKNKLVTAERVAEIDAELSEILGQLGEYDHITPGHPGKSVSGKKR